MRFARCQLPNLTDGMKCVNPAFITVNSFYPFALAKDHRKTACPISRTVAHFLQACRRKMAPGILSRPYFYDSSCPLPFVTFLDWRFARCNRKRGSKLRVVPWGLSGLLAALDLRSRGFDELAPQASVAFQKRSNRGWFDMDLMSH